MRCFLSAPQKEGETNDNSSINLVRNFGNISFTQLGGEMFKDLILTWLFKGLEIVLVAVLGYGLYLIIDGILAKFWAICGLSIIMFYWGALAKPYIDKLRKWIYAKITGIDKEEF